MKTPAILALATCCLALTACPEKEKPKPAKPAAAPSAAPAAPAAPAAKEEEGGW